MKNFKWEDAPEWAELLLQHKSSPDCFAFSCSFKDGSKAKKINEDYEFPLIAEFWELVKIRSLVINNKNDAVNEAIEQPGNPKYDKKIIGKYGSGSCVIDVYRFLDAYEVTNPQLQHLIKKASNAGKRGHKDERQDLIDILDSAQSALNMYDDKGLSK